MTPSVLLQETRRRLKVLLSASLALLLAACASGPLTDTWCASYQGPALRTVLVIGVAASASARRSFEDAFAGKLQVAGVAATPSHTLLPDGGRIEEHKLRTAVVQSGADGVLIVRVVRIDRRADYHPGSIGPAPTLSHRRSFYDYYAAAWVAPPTVYRKSYEIAVTETNLWSTTGEQLIWSASTETFTPREARRETSEFAAVVIEALRESGLI